MFFLRIKFEGYGAHRNTHHSMSSIPPMPSSAPVLTRTFSTYGHPAYEACVDYLWLGGSLPSQEHIQEGVPEMMMQITNGGFHFTSEQETRWQQLQALAVPSSKN